MTYVCETCGKERNGAPYREDAGEPDGAPYRYCFPCVKKAERYADAEARDQAIIAERALWEDVRHTARPWID